MRRTILPLVLSLVMLLTGCQSWNVNAFGMPMGESTNYATVSSTPPRTPAPSKLGYHAAEPKHEPLSKEEKTGVIVVVGLAIALAVVGIVAAS